jgi:hypothetical protein
VIDKPIIFGESYMLAGAAGGDHLPTLSDKNVQARHRLK